MPKLKKESYGTRARKKFMLNKVNRMDSDKRKVEQEQDSIRRRTVRENSVVRIREQLDDTQRRKQRRENSSIRKTEQTEDSHRRRIVRENLGIRLAEQEENSHRRRAVRENPTVRLAEQEKDSYRRRVARENPVTRLEEQGEDSRRRRRAREVPSVRAAEQKLNTELKKARRIELDPVTEFNKCIMEGPTYVCACCEGLFFKTSVKVLSRDKLTKDVLEGIPESTDEKEFLCGTCHQYLTSKNPSIPRLCSSNGLKFPEIPAELKGLTQLEERLVAGRIPFMQIRKLGVDRQCGIKGNVINVINPVNDTIRILPRQFNEASVVFLMLMRKMEYKNPYLFETIRPSVVYNAARYLASTELYKEEGIVLSTDWLEKLPNIENVEFKTNSDVNDVPSFTPASSAEEIHQEPNPMNPGGQETLIVDVDLLEGNEVHKFAPGEGQRPISLLIDKNAEALAFPSIYCGTKRQLTISSITVKDIAKWEARCKDRRCAIPSKLLFSYRKTQLHQIANEISICLRKKKGSSIPTAGDLLNCNFVGNLLQHDDGFRFLKNIRSSPAYWQDKQKDLMAMIRQIGIPTLFITLSAAEVKWPELTRILVNIHKKKTITLEEAEALTWEEKADLIRKDPITCSRYFDYRLRQCKKFLLGKSGIFQEYPVKDFFWRIEFQHRGSPHMHGLFWLQDAPIFLEEDPKTFFGCCNFIDKFVSCSNDVLGVVHQSHKHTDCCQVSYKGESRCRFGMPYPPMDVTEILLPYPTDFCPSLWKKCKAQFKMIQQLAEERHKMDPEIKFQDFLDLVGLTRNQYIMAVRSSIIRPTVFLRRQVKDVFYNAFNPTLAAAWKANMDIQFILDPYACCKYVAAYISKSNRGMSELLKNIVKEAEAGNLSVKEKLKAVGHTFLKGSEVSAQEAAYGVLGLPLTMSSRDVVYINTSKPEERVHIVKSSEELKRLDEDSYDVIKSSNIEHYSKRPLELENIVLADFVSLWTFSTRKPNNGNKLEQMHHQDVEERGDECCDDFEENDDEILHVLKTEGGWLKRRRTPRVVRMRNFGEKMQPDDFFREQLMLYWPWRNEDVDLLTRDCAELYKLHQGEINKARQRFDKRIDFTKVNYFEEQEDHDLPEEFKIDDEYEVMHFEGVSQDYENLDLVTERHREKISLPNMLGDEEYNLLIGKLNTKQKKYHDHVLESLAVGKKLFEYVEGGAGVGKSLLITAVTQSLIRRRSKEVGKDPSRLCILLCAPTGVAAFNIKGCTLHQAFALPFGQNANKMKRLSENVRNRLACEYKDVELVISDEASMTSSDMHEQMNERLQQIFKSKEPFGGISVIQVGNFHQLPPVMGSYIFEDPKKGLAAISTNQLWPLFKFFELTECMRQKEDKKFAEALNRLAVGECTEDDVQMFKSREIKKCKVKAPDSAIRLKFCNNDVDCDNQKKLATMNSEGIVSYANDRVQGTGLEKHHEAIRRAVKNLSAKETQGLPSEVPLKVGARYMLTVNRDTSDGLVNGAIGTLMKITYGTTVCGRKVPVKVWIDFPKDVGKKLRMKAKCPEDLCWVPLDQERRVVHSWPHRNLDVVRCQFALVPAECITIHKSQGSTFKTAVISVKYTTKFGDKYITRRGQYVAFSRCTSLEGLYIDGDFRAPPPPLPNDPVMRELRRLKSNPVFMEDFVAFEEGEQEKDNSKFFKNATVLDKALEETKFTRAEKSDKKMQIQQASTVTRTEERNSKRIAQVAGHTIYESDLETLKPRQWLNTKIVDAYLDLLTEAFIGNFHNFGEHFLSYIERHWDDIWESNWEIQTTSNVMAFPLCLNSHWTLFLADRTKSLIIFYDSKLLFEHRGKLEVIRRFIQVADQKYGRIPVNWTMQEISLTEELRQNDWYNCGVYICFFAKCYAEGLELSSLPRGFRPYIRNCMLTNRL